MNWDDPLDRLRLVESVGHNEYNRMIREHIQKITVDGVRPVMTRFGQLWHVVGTNEAFSDMATTTSMGSTRI